MTLIANIRRGRVRVVDGPGDGCHGPLSETRSRSESESEIPASRRRARRPAQESVVIDRRFESITDCSHGRPARSGRRSSSCSPGLRVHDILNMTMMIL